MKFAVDLKDKMIEEMVDDIDNGYIRDAESCADDLKGLIE